MARTTVIFPAWAASALALLIALGMVLTLDLLTNTLDVRAFTGDFYYYLDMTE